MSSESRAGVAPTAEMRGERSRVAVYAFEQLKATATTVGTEDVLAAAWADAERLREEARAAGEAEGRAAGLAAAREQAAPALLALAQALDGVESLRAELAAALEVDAVDLAFRVAEQVLAGALDAQPQRVLEVVRGALRRLAERQRVTVLVNPTDLQLVSDGAEALRGELGGIEHCEVQADRRIGRGGAVVRAVEGEIDAQVATQLATARDVVRQELSRQDVDEPR